MVLLSFDEFCREVGASQRTVTIALGRKGWSSVADPADRRRRGYPRDWIAPIKEEIRQMVLDQAKKSQR